MAKKKADDPKNGRTGSKPSAAELSPEQDSPDSTAEKFPIIGLGASAGGLEALKAFFAAITGDIGFAYIVVVHMAPKQPSMLGELLQKITPVPVLAAADGQRILPGHIYVIPPNKELTIHQGRIQLSDVVSKNIVLPIDMFFRSLAHDQKENAAAVVLSGTGTDGTLGIKEIKANDGLIIVQSEKSAAYDGMPRSAVNTGLADMVLPPGEMFAALVQYFSSPCSFHELKAAHKEATIFQKNWLRKIFAVLHAQTGHDFSTYKANTMLRRISRRMGVNQITDHEQYIRFLRKEPLESEALFRELLIGVTNFFRDKPSFDILKKMIIPQALDRIEEDGTFRVWVPGCSTGEEVYSLAMVIRECLDPPPGLKHVNLQLFGTDIDGRAIDKAREGVFPESIAADVDAKRLSRFFIKEGNFFRIRKEIRAQAVFSVQDVVKDPPFSRLNLLCCRNLLIYLNAATQKRILPLFHYTLVLEGILMLGSSETIGGFTNLFDIIDKKWKIFRRREVPNALRKMVDFPSGKTLVDNGYALPSTSESGPKFDIGLLTQQALLKQFVPTAVLIDAKGDVLYIQGRTGKYLEASSGLPSYNILDLAREGLRIELSSAIRAAKTSGKEIIRRKIKVKTNGDIQTINLRVYPQNSPKELAGRLLVVFEDTDVEAQRLEKGAAPQDNARLESEKIAELEQELQNTLESHQTTIEELESSNEELKSTNEELQSTNEELQSTNEELESSKEELQSLNEELHTVNAELQSKVEELSAARDDMHNLLNSTEIATIFVDNDLRVRRFTPEATAIVNLIQTDIGRPLQHIMHNLTYMELIADLTDALKKLTPRNIEVQTKKGKWYDMRIMPYRTTDNRIDGAVLTFSDIQEQKSVQAEQKRSIRNIETAGELTRAVFDLNPDPMLVIEKEGRMVMANRAFCAIVGIAQKNIENVSIFDVQNEIVEAIVRQSDLKAYLLQGENFKCPAFKVTALDKNLNFSVHGYIIKKNNNVQLCTLLQFVKEGRRG